jgi:elongation factor P
MILPFARVFSGPPRRRARWYQNMSATPATRLKKGNLIVLEGELYRILELQHVTPGNLRGFVRVKMRNIRNGALADQRLRSEDTVQRAVLDEIEMQYMYSDAAGHHFMDTKTYEQISLSDEVLGELIGYLRPESLIKVEFHGAEPVGIELPQNVDLVVKDTSPAIKGATASAQLKPATLETGLVVNVPPFINIGDTIRVNTESGEYQSRA